jgi:hypothetical protein
MLDNVENLLATDDMVELSIDNNPAHNKYYKYYNIVDTKER